MLDFQQKRKVKSFMYNRVTLAVLLVVVLFVLNSTWSVYQKKRESERLKNVALGNVENLRGRNSELQVKIERLGTEVGIEEENAVIIVPKSETNATSTNSSSFWQKVKKFFGM